MSISKELRERFTKEPEKDTSDLAQELLKGTFALASEDMAEVVISDISGMLRLDYRKALDGYILCLSRIISHERAWDYISEAFQACGEKVPAKYYERFGRTQESEVKPKRLVGK